MKVLVFGGTGWIGKRIATYFMNSGYDVTICSRSWKNPTLENFKVINIDKNNYQEVEALLTQNSYDIIIDSVPAINTLNAVFDHAKNLKHYIHCSSTGGYAPLPFIPCDETAFYEGFAGGWKLTKKALDNLAMELFLTKGFPATVIRPCYITGEGKLPLDNRGARRESFLGELQRNETMEVLGTGNTLLQPIYADDLAYSFLLAAEVPQISKGQIYNICLEKAVTHNRYLEINASIFNTKPVINYISLSEMQLKYFGENNENVGLNFFAEHMCFDISKAKSQLGFKPSCSSETAIERTAWANAKELGLI